MGKRCSAAVEKVLIWFDAWIKSAKAGPGADRLPSVRKIAAACRVNGRTVLKALDILKKQKRVSGGNGCVYRIAGSAKASMMSKALPAMQAFPSTMYEQLRKDIITGVFPSGTPLPSQQQLRKKYHTSPETLRQCLSALCDEGLAIRAGRSYIVKQSANPKGYCRIALLGTSYNPNKGIAAGHNDNQLAMLIHLLAAQRSITVDNVGIYRESGNPAESYGLFESYTAASYRLFDDCIGYVLLMSIDKMSDYLPVLQQLAGYKKPVVCIDEIGTWPRAFASRHPNIHHLSLTLHPESTREVAQHLIGRGHRHIAYISPFANTAWSQIRERVLRQEYEKMGDGYSVASLSYQVRKEISRKRAVSDSFIGEITDTFNRWKPRLGDDVSWEFEGAFHRVTLGLAFNRGYTKSTLRQRLPALLEDTSITAWVCVNDNTAAVAQDILLRAGKKVPKDIALVSFDDTELGQTHGISSYNYNIPGLAHFIMELIVKGSAPGYGAFPYVPGTLVQRRSSR